MKAAYGTFLTALMVEYCHDQVADNLTSEFNVTWSRTGSIAVLAGDDAYSTYLTLLCDHDMGMTVVGLPEDVTAFNFACSSVISDIEYNIMNGLWFDYQANIPGAGYLGSVMTDMMNAFMNGTSLEAFESNGYVVLKAENRTDLIYVIDPETGIVRDINTVGGFCGAYCYYDLQTNLAETLGTNLVNDNDPYTNQLDNYENFLKNGLSEEYRIDSTGVVPPSKLNLVVTLLIGSFVLEYYDSPKVVYNKVNSSDYNDNNTVLVFNNIPINTNQSIINITEIKKSGT